MMKFPTEWKVIKNIPNHQPAVCWLYLDVGAISHSNQLDSKDPPSDGNEDEDDEEYLMG
jgi:hypothetical protein